jgi:hypothetical protein
MPTPGWAKSASMCHVAHIYWATSAPVGPTPVKSARKWAPPVCHVAVSDKAMPHGSTLDSTHQQINPYAIKHICHMSLSDW